MITTTEKLIAHNFTVSVHQADDLLDLFSSTADSINNL